MHDKEDLRGAPVPADNSSRPVPSDVIVERPYWDSCRQHWMHIQRCDECGNYRFYPGYVCDRCGATSLAWWPVSGRGKVHTYSVVYRPAGGFAEIPYVWALVELDEGVVMASNIVGCEVDDVRVDMRVQVVYADATPDWTIPYFRPVEEAA